MITKYKVQVVATMFAVAVANSAHAVPRSCVITFAVGLSEPMGALQFTVDYSRVQGTFVNQVSSPSCRTVVAGGHVFTGLTCKGEYGACQWGDERMLKIATMFDAELKGPADVVECEFLTDGEPQLDGFTVVLDGAGAPETGRGLRRFPPHLSARSIACHSN